MLWETLAQDLLVGSVRVDYPRIHLELVIVGESRRRVERHRRLAHEEFDHARPLRQEGVDAVGVEMLARLVEEVGDWRPREVDARVRLWRLIVVRPLHAADSSPQGRA